MFIKHSKRNNIEISTSFPYLIRSASDPYEICEEQVKDGDVYVKVPIRIVKGDVRLHDIEKKILIAEHFIPNNDPDLYRCVGHHDNNKLNLEPSNLYWCTIDKMISRKIQTRQYTDSLPTDSTPLRSFNGHDFGDHYFYSPSTQKIYYETKRRGYCIASMTRRNNSNILSLQDVNGITRGVTLSKIINHFQNQI